MTTSGKASEGELAVEPAGSPPTLKERQRQEREQLILRAAADLLAEHGYHEMSLEDIAARVGIAKGTIYLHFASKDDLVLALMLRGRAMYIKALDTALESAPTPREKLLAVIDHFTTNTFNQGFHAFAAIMRNPAIISRMSEMREEMKQQWEGPRRRLEAAIDEGKAIGDIDPKLPTPLIAAMLMCLLNPHDQRQLVDENGLTPEQIAASLRTFFMRGIAAKPSDCPMDDSR